MTDRFRKKIQHEHLGSEFDWLAVDEHGRCFFISSAGFGWIPESVTAASYPSQALSLVLGLPIHAKATLHRDQGSSTEWGDAATRGFYAIDWDHGSSTYVLVAEPDVPLLSAQLPVEVLRVVGMAVVDLNWSKRTVDIGSPRS